MPRPDSKTSGYPRNPGRFCMSNGRPSAHDRSGRSDLSRPHALVRSSSTRRAVTGTSTPARAAHLTTSLRAKSYLVSKQTDYHWAPARLVAENMRNVELKAGYPRVPRGTRSPSSPTQAAQREQERRVLAQAELAYRALVDARKLQGDAAATKGGTS